MARKVLIDLVEAVGTFMAKTNTLSEYIGDLDDLHPDFDSNYADSNIVSSLNWLSEQFDSINNRLFGQPPGILRVGGISGDSASFKRLRVGTMTADSATIDSATIKHAHITGSLFADSAYFDNIGVDSIGVDAGATLHIDSAHVVGLKAGKLIVDSADFQKIRVEHIHIDSNATLVIDSATVTKLNVTDLTIDSARVNKLTAGTAIIDSATIDSATITDAYITNFHMDNKQLDNLKLFTVKNEAGTTVLSGYFLSTSNTPGQA